MKFLDFPFEFQISRAVAGKKAAVIGGKERLADLFIEGHAAEGFFDPLLRCRRQPVRSPPDILRAHVLALRLRFGAASGARVSSHKKEQGEEEKPGDAPFHRESVP